MFNEVESLKYELEKLKEPINADSERPVETFTEQESVVDYEEKIYNHLEGNNIILLTNQIRFDSIYYRSESVRQESILSWLPINPVMRIRDSFRVVKTEVELQDLHVDLDDVTVFGADSLFELKMQPSRVVGEASRAGKVHDVHFEMGKEKKVLQRHIYTVLDLLSDVGGVQGLLISVFAIIVTCLNKDHFEERLVG